MLIPFLQCCARMPLAGLHFFGAGLGWLVYALSPTWRRRCRENLRASGVCAGDADCRRLVHATVAESGKSITELCKVWFGRDDEIAQLVSCDDWAVVETAQRAGKGVIFLTPHLGCFEISALYGAQRLPLTVLYRPPKRAALETIMQAGRAHGRITLAPATLKGVRLLYKALQRGEAIGVLPDQAPGVGEGEWADFFGRPAYTMTLVTRLQQTTGAAVIMAFAERLPRGRGYHLHLQTVTGPLDPSAMNRAVEAIVRTCPAQYLWGYNRYKVPAGAEPPPAVIR
ncbi:MAG: lysophospholipid acyltransferase family protein [Burkholderiales bacterium]|jgi:KDO2-lipid IV(A) lauroyltransferase|nr:lysophospholipid acyltransferase family protein [Burkholderiales bacterium]